MSRKKAPATADHVPDAGNMPSWFDDRLHRVEPRGIVASATGDLLAEDGLPVNAHARAAWLASDAAEAATVAEQPPAETAAPAAAEQE